MLLKPSFQSDPRKSSRRAQDEIHTRLAFVALGAGIWWSAQPNGERGRDVTPPGSPRLDEPGTTEPHAVDPIARPVECGHPFFPEDPGASRRYRIAFEGSGPSAGIEGTLVFSLIDVRVDEGDRVATWEMTLAAEGAGESTVEIDRRCRPNAGAEEYWFGAPAVGGMVTFGPVGWRWPRELVAADVFGGDVTMTVMGRGTHVVHRTHTVEGVETRETRAGTFETTRVRITQQSDTGSSSEVVWVAPGIGMVRSEQPSGDLVAVMELIELHTGG